MKTFLRTIILLVLLVSLNSMKCEEIRESSSYEPVVLGRAEFESAVTLYPARPIYRAGKIYIKDDLMFLNEINAGFHVYDYSTPTAPTAIAFINIPGATDLAIRDNIIYINQAVDLVTLSYNTGSDQLEVLFRNRNVFPPKMSPDGFFNSEDDEIVIEWIQN